LIAQVFGEEKLKFVISPIQPPSRRHQGPFRDLLRDFEKDGLEVYNSPQANLDAALVELG
jgi:hypothetical protein